MIMLAAFAAVSMSVSAQEAFQTFYLQYNPSWQKYSHNSYTLSTSYNELSLGYSYAMPVASFPLYVEFGGAVQWAFKSEDNDGYDTTSNLIAAKIPVNALYGIQVSDAITILPYAGPYFRFNILGKNKVKHGGQSETTDWFSDGDAKRFQIGLNAGCRVNIKDTFFAGVGYYYDLMKIQEHTHFEGIDITIGLLF